MKNKKIIICLIAVIVIVIVTACVTLFVLNKTSGTEEEPTTQKEKKYICTREMYSEDDMQGLFIIEFSENAEGNISSLEPTTQYIIKTDAKYQEVKDNFAQCTDTYKDNKTIVCEVELTGEWKKTFNSSASIYNESLTNSGFTCKTE